MRRLIGVRKSQKAFGRGTQEFLHPANKKVLIFLRRHESEVVLCVNNLSRYAQPVELDLREFSGLVPMELWSCEAFPTIGDLPYFFTMAPHGFLWFRLVPPADVASFKKPK
jgi:maltose alpha-D-glucosyltransferase/alpha-amylase